MKLIYVVWQYVIHNIVTGAEYSGVKTTQLDLNDINERHFRAPCQMDEIDWLECGLFLNVFMLGYLDRMCGGDEISQEVNVFNIYRNAEEAHKAHIEVSARMAEEELSKYKKLDKTLN